jgi:formate dehydrogenase subunit gamma
MADNPVRRFIASELTTHVVLFGSLIILSITGLTLKYHESWLSQWIIRIEGGVLFRGVIHRTAALLLIAVFVYHVLCVVFTRRGREFLGDMAVTRKDFADFRDLVKYNLGLRREMPRFDRFTCIEKLQYWASGIAVILLSLSGFILWFETSFMIILPKWVMDLNRMVHSFEATVVFLILVVWHLYNVHLNPRVFPMSRVWLTGTISKADMKKDHPIEYERLFGNEKE